MTNILTAAEGANFIRTTADDAVMLQLLPLVDEYLYNATGHDWAADTTIYASAKLAAGMLLTFWYDNPGAIGTAPTALVNQMLQLEAVALKYRKYEFDGRSGGGSICIPGARQGDEVQTLTGVYNESGDQKSKFESIVSEDNYLLQTSTADLSDASFVVVLKHPADDVRA